jgi:hypothetical protein
MKTLIIYDNTGKIFTNITGFYIVPEGIQYLEIEVPEGKRVERVDTTDIENPVPVYVDIPKEEIVQLKDAVDTLIVDNLNMQMQIDALIMSSL